MILERIYEEKLSQAGYLVACEHTRRAVVVDPNLDIAAYLDAAARVNVTIVAVTETHIHADYVSGARELASHVGAELYLSGTGGPDWKYELPSESGAKMLSDGTTFMVGDVRIEAVHTPGHTPEHLTFLVTDTSTANEPMGALTGDFIFVGDVGRPDLLERAAGMEGTMDAGARQLFQSLQAFKRYPDWLQIWPGHGAGSACGKALGAMPQSTLGYEKRFNWALCETDKERFVAQVLAGQPEPPAYFALMKRINRDGSAEKKETIPMEARAADVARVLLAGEAVVDTRPMADFAAQHVIGSINIPRTKSFLKWSGALLPYDREILVIGPADEESRRSLAADLSLIGIHSISGVFPSDTFSELSRAGIEMESGAQIEARETETQGRHVLDVRGRSEYQEGHIPGAINIPLVELQRRLDEVPPGPVAVHCQGGSRSAIAASILQQSGRLDVANMTGGFTEWTRSGNPVETEVAHQGD